MIIPIHIFPFGEIDPEYIGYIESEDFDAERCWHLCNWSHWAPNKPAELHSDIDTCGRGVCFMNPHTGETWLAKSIGWEIGEFGDVVKYVEANKDKTMWR